MTASASNDEGYVTQVFPNEEQVDTEIPERARKFLVQAIDSIHAPDGAIMLAASAVDAMLKQKGYKDGTLNERINKAEKDNLVTTEMAKWAHQVRIDANDPRHADVNASPTTEQDAKRCVEFAKALVLFMFTLPARVTRGIEDSK